ncbi:hypothetical protein ACTXT7_004459 [Hymenolepis weldensis]
MVLSYKVYNKTIPHTLTTTFRNSGDGMPLSSNNMYLALDYNDLSWNLITSQWNLFLSLCVLSSKHNRDDLDAVVYQLDQSRNQRKKEKKKNGKNALRVKLSYDDEIRETITNETTEEESERSHGKPTKNGGSKRKLDGCVRSHLEPARKKKGRKTPNGSFSENLELILKEASKHPEAIQKAADFFAKLAERKM